MQVTSQRFRDHMDRVKEEHIEEIQIRMLKRIKKEYGLSTSLVLYDTTNFFTHIGSTNTRSVLARRGHNKQKRYDLRQLGLALAVSGRYQIPLLHHVYQGNINDVKLFPDMVEKIMNRISTVFNIKDEPTLVFDRGNLSYATLEYLLRGEIPFIAAVPYGQYTDIGMEDETRLKPVRGLPGTLSYGRDEVLFGRTCRFLLMYTESFFTKQLNGVCTNLVKAQSQLMDLSKRLQHWSKAGTRGKRPTLKSVEKKLDEILSAQFMRRIIRVDLRGNAQTGIPIIDYRIDHDELERLSKERFGRTILITNRTMWEPKKIIESYRSLYLIEDVFKSMKNTDYLHWQPAWHWTDQKLMVHGFYCVLGVTLSRILHMIAHRAGVNLSWHQLLEELGNIKETAIIYPKGELLGRSVTRHVLTYMNPTQRKLFNLFELQKYFI